MYSLRLHHQSGIALGPILFIIAVLAIIAAAIAAGAGGFNVSGKAESSKLIASAIIDQIGVVQNAVQKVRTDNSCGDTQISFAHPNLPTSYNNPNAPADGSCNIFSPNGGGIGIPPAAPVMPSDAYYSQPGGENANYFLYYLGNGGGGCSGFTGIGTPTNQQIALIVNVNQAVCFAINQQLGISQSPTEFDVYLSTSPFAGSYPYDGNPSCSSNGNWTYHLPFSPNFLTFCTSLNSSREYQVYSFIMIR